MITTARRTLATAVAATTLLALAGCGGNDDSKTAEKASDTSSASTSASASSSSGSSSGSSAQAGSGEPISGEEFAAKLKTALDKATTAHMTLALGDALGNAEGDADYTKTPPELDVKMNVQALGGAVELRLVGGKFYMQSPPLGEKWLSFDLDDPNSPLGALGSQLDPVQQFESFGKAVTSATDDGAEDVDGESLEHFTATVDTATLLQSSSLPSAAAGGGELPDTMTQEWWFDGDGLIRKFSSDFAGTATTLTLSKWGEPVTIEAPPADQVTQAPGGGMGSGA